MAEVNEYPKQMLKNGNSRTAHNKRDEEQFRLEGWAPHYTFQEYPKMVNGVRCESLAEEELAKQTKATSSGTIEAMRDTVDAFTTVPTGNIAKKGK